VSVVVIMFELTGALTYILPTMIVVGVTKAVGELFGKGGIADRMIWFSGFPFLDNKEDHNFGVPVSQAMISEVVALPAHGMTLKNVERLLAQDTYQGFPIVEDPETKILVGYIGRTELRYAVEKARKEGRVRGDTRCIFSSANPNAITPITPATAVPFFSDAATVDFSRFVDSTPVTVHPRLPLETVMELFRKIGPRVVLIEYHGRLTGLVTVKDCLKYQFKVEAAENPRDESRLVEGQERLWDYIRQAAGWVSDKVNSASGGRIRLSSSSDEGGGTVRPGALILEGTEDVGDDDGVELETR